MSEAYISLLQAFNFTEMQAWIAVISAFMFTSCLLGGILSALSYVNSSDLQPRPLSERISFRLFILLEFLLWVFVFFYHVFMIEEITISHIVYWVSATMMMPLLGIIGSQTILVVFSGRIKKKEQDLKRRQKSIREKKMKDQEEAEGKTNPKAPTKKAAGKPGARGTPRR